MIHKVFKTKDILAGFCFLQVFLSYLFDKGKGLIAASYLKEDAVLYVTDLLSSGSDDNICIEVGVIIFSVLGFWFLIRRNTIIYKSDYIAIIITSLSQIKMLTLIEAGSIIETITIDGNIVLLAWYINLFVINVAFFLIWKRERANL